MYKLAKAYPPEVLRKKFVNGMLKQSHAGGIEAHYDISNDFYALFLDTKYRFYTCAEHTNDDEILEDAQTNKAKYLYNLLDLHGNEKILDLGCGWGSMLKFLLDSGHKGPLYGYTLSKEQLAYARDNLNLNVSLCNFITEPLSESPYDRILSIGSFEHIRPNELFDVYKKTYDALVPGGIAVHQFFSLNHEQYPPATVVGQLFFPGSTLSLHSKHIDAAEKAGFIVKHDSIHDYKPTLKAWYDRLAANEIKAIELVGLEIYNRYMIFFPLAWRMFYNKVASLHRIALQKPTVES